MSETKRRAMEARSLSDNPAFKAIIQEIRNSAGQVFFDPLADVEALTKAHAQVRAVHTFLDALQARIDAEAIEDHKKGLHRGSDRQDGGSG